MSAIIYHWHHIIPRHAGGTDDPSNLVKLTIEEHAEAHRLLWEQHGRLEDKMAWKLLAGQGREGWAIGQALAKQANTGDNNVMRRDSDAKRKCLSSWQKWAAVDDNRKFLIEQATKNLQKATEHNRGKKRPRHSLFMSEWNKQWWRNNREHLRDIMSSEWKLISPEGAAYVTNRLEDWCHDNHLPYTTIWKNHKVNTPIKKGNAKGWKTILL